MYPEMSDISIFQGMQGAGRFARTPAIRTDPFNGSIQSVRKLDSLLLNPFGNRSVWMAATAPPCLKINVLYRTDCVDQVSGAAPM
jgi:hypothetical protein